MIRQALRVKYAPQALQNSVSLSGMTTALQIEHVRLVRRAWRLYALALAPSRRRYLERCVIRASGRVDPHFGPEFLIGALLTLGPTSDGRVWRTVERLQGHHDVRVRGAAGECLRLLGRERG